MRLFVFALFLVGFVEQCHAQDSLKILGRWKVVGMNNGVNFNYKNEHFTVSKTLGETLRGRSDSAKVVADFLDWARSCSNCFYVFGSKNSYREYRDEDLRSEGTFYMKSSQQEIQVSFLKGGTIKNATYRFKLENEQLILYVPSFFIKDDLELRLEKTTIQ